MGLMIKTFKATNHPLTYRPFVKMWDFFLFIFFSINVQLSYGSLRWYISV